MTKLSITGFVNEQQLGHTQTHTTQLCWLQVIDNLCAVNKYTRQTFGTWKRLHHYVPRRRVVPVIPARLVSTCELVVLSGDRPAGSCLPPGNSLSAGPRTDQDNSLIPNVLFTARA